ncbi:hypothetical protein LZL87_007899 [Fusarium oxysporum]|nr:hypothetical protein LZL87_007899 [Fusarium oxysporum]
MRLSETRNLGWRKYRAEQRQEMNLVQNKTCLTWEYRHIDILKFETRTPQHRKLHPFGKVPILDVLDDRGETLLRICESRAIARYVAIAYPNQGDPLMPDITDANAMASFEEAASMEVCYFSTTAWKYCGDIIVKPILGIPRVDKKILEDIWNELNGALKAMDGILSSREYLAGAHFTLVDIWSMPWVSQLIDLKGSDVLFSELPHVRDWWERVSLRPAWKEACELMNKAMEEMRQNAAKTDAPDTQRITRGGRRKRNEYALVACMLCKSRKVKCDGQWPCQRCTKRGVDCSYPRRGKIPSMSPVATEMSLGMEYSPSTDDGATPRISATSGSTTLNEAARQPAQTSNSLSASLQSPAATERSPTARRSSFVNTFSLARSCLEANGIVDQVEKDAQGSTNKPHLTLEQSLASANDDCWDSVLELGYDKARHLFITFAETIYPIYPCVDLHSTEQVLDMVFGRSASHTTQVLSVNLTKVDILKALLGLTLLVEDDSKSPLARHLQRYVDWSVEKVIIGRGLDTDDVAMATLMSLYFFHKSEHMKAWRLISLASRTCFELGLHQAPEEAQKAVEIPGSFSPRELFCCVYVLDRTFSFATDLPHTTKDEDIDEKCFDLKYGSVTLEYYYGNLSFTHTKVIERRQQPQQTQKPMDQRVEMPFKKQSEYFRIGERLHMPKDNNTPLLQEFGDIDMGQLLVDPQCVGSGDLQTLDDSIFGLFGMNRNWPANNSYI